MSLYSDLNEVLTPYAQRIKGVKADLTSKLELTANSSATIPDNADFNSYKTAGTYKVTNNEHAATMINIPLKSAGKLIVLELSQTARAIQFYVLSNTTYPIYTRYYQRTTTGESWSAWDRLAKFSVVKEIEDRVSAIEDDLTSKLELTANSSTTIPDNADFNSYKTAGTYKVTNNEHAATMINIPVKSAGKLIVLELSQTARAIQIYVLPNTNYPIYTRYYQSTTSGESWTAWDSIAKFSSITAIEDRVTAIEGTLKSPKIKYESGSFENGLATERISVYIPATTGFLMYRLYHFVDTDINCNCWQIYNLYFVNDTLGGQTDLTAKGEWECALHLSGRDDFSGGHTHGDELFTSLTVLLDGVPVDVSTLTTNTEFNKLTIIRTSKLYDPSDHTTEIAEHGVEYVFTKDGLTVRQSIKWLVSEELTNCFMAMFLPLKAKIDKAFFNSRYDVSNLASSASERTSTVTAIKATSTTMWDSDGGLSGTITILHYPTGLTGGDNASISDNGGLNYNKLYYKVCGTGYTSSVGELWQSESVYALNFNT